jgi:ribulose 1,5-bisphosphate synthetase/thiazole synthase
MAMSVVSSPSTAVNPEVIIVGAGHNGLPAGCRLARAGRCVTADKPLAHAGKYSPGSMSSGSTGG